MAAGILLLYAGGMALNDLFDARIDAAQRPGRPIPSGRVSPLGAAIFGTVTIVAGAVVTTIVGPTSLVPISVLIATILIYDLTHKQAASAVVLMGMCRGLIYVAAAAAIAVPIDWRIAAPLVLALTVYTIALTIVARVEDGGRLGAWRWIVPLMPLIIAAPAIALRPDTPEGRWITTAAGIAVVGWLVLAARNALGSPPRFRDAILKWLSGMCLVDAVYLGMLDQPVAAIVRRRPVLRHRRGPSRDPGNLTWRIPPSSSTSSG